MTTILKNKKAKFDYEILDTFDAGIELFGCEVKALRAGKGKLNGSHVVIRGGEAYLVGTSISPYQPKNTPKNYDPERPRRLLLTKKELNKLLGIETSKNLTLIPISLYNKERYLKIKIASVRGKKKSDKREAIKERDTKRDIDRIMKERNR